MPAPAFHAPRLTVQILIPREDVHDPTLAPEADVWADTQWPDLPRARRAFPYETFHTVWVLPPPGSIRGWACPPVIRVLSWVLYAFHSHRTTHAARRPSAHPTSTTSREKTAAPPQTGPGVGRRQNAQTRHPASQGFDHDWQW